MSTYQRGAPHTFTAEFFEYPGGPPINLGSVSFSVRRVFDSVVILAPTTVDVSNPSTGFYAYTWTLPNGLLTEDHVALWASSVAPSGNAAEVFGVTSATSGIGTGPCDPWPVQWICPLDAESAAVTGMALDAATEMLWALSGRQFGLCTITVRPCRRQCGEWPGGSSWLGVVPGSIYPMPAKIGSQWLNLTCGYCTSGCSCATVSEVVLPAPTYSVLEVLVDGIALDTSAYRLDESRLLVRTDGNDWPICNNLNLADTESGTWSVTLQYGQTVPVLGTMAVGELACEFVKLLLDDDSCALPQPIQQLTRQGVSITYLDPAEMLSNGRTGLRLADQFISTYNPSGLRSRARTYDVDGSGIRRIGTS